LDKFFFFSSSRTINTRYDKKKNTIILFMLSYFHAYALYVVEQAFV